MSKILTGYDAINHAHDGGPPLCKYADPIEGERIDISVDEALDIAADDPELIWIWCEVKP